MGPTQGGTAGRAIDQRSLVSTRRKRGLEFWPPGTESWSITRRKRGTWAGFLCLWNGLRCEPFLSRGGQILQHRGSQLGTDSGGAVGWIRAWLGDNQNLRVDPGKKTGVGSKCRGRGSGVAYSDAL